jgi:ABC-type nitrate/sulfonate/bicarbonate transport system substrate-binding protein
VVATATGGAVVAGDADWSFVATAAAAGVAVGAADGVPIVVVVVVEHPATTIATKSITIRRGLYRLNSIANPKREEIKKHIALIRGTGQ